MRITVGNFVLCGGERASERLEAFALDGQRLLQEEELVGAAEEGCFDRGNSRRAISFRVTREHDTFLDSEDYALEHDEGIPDGDQVVEYQAEGSTRRSLFQRGHVERHRVEVTGVTTFHTYTIVGGKLSRTRPTS